MVRVEGGKTSFSEYLPWPLLWRVCLYLDDGAADASEVCDGWLILKCERPGSGS